MKPSYAGATLHTDRDGHVTNIPDPDTMSPDERRAMLEVVRVRLGIVNNH